MRTLSCVWDFSVVSFYHVMKCVLCFAGAYALLCIPAYSLPYGQAETMDFWSQGILLALGAPFICGCMWLCMVGGGHVLALPIAIDEDYRTFRACRGDAALDVATASAEQDDNPYKSPEYM